MHSSICECTTNHKDIVIVSNGSPSRDFSVCSVGISISFVQGKNGKKRDIDHLMGLARPESNDLGTIFNSLTIRQKHLNLAISFTSDEVEEAALRIRRSKSKLSDDS